MGAKNRVGKGLLYRTARRHSLAELVPWNRFLGSYKSLKSQALELWPIEVRTCDCLYKYSQLAANQGLPSYECLSRQSSLVINIVGTDDISRLPRLATGLTDDVWGGGVTRRSTLPPAVLCTLLSLLFCNSRPPTRGLGHPAAANGQEG